MDDMQVNLRKELSEDWSKHATELENKVMQNVSEHTDGLNKKPENLEKQTKTDIYKGSRDTEDRVCHHLPEFGKAD
ncbi:hypothetical protein LSTR_LSTR010352 [Laodelphax striatellus]|uniref:Uncharacterized protein n=1 Tax=Laodelphax striatellus TaxID=195883 RepID=A0A482X0I4_LAOST|nr:hypothetical protein LSTR_LSTR010352 [Laodelphax striatellus]